MFFSRNHQKKKVCFLSPPLEFLTSTSSRLTTCFERFLQIRTCILLPFVFVDWMSAFFAFSTRRSASVSSSSPVPSTSISKSVSSPASSSSSLKRSSSTLSKEAEIEWYEGCNPVREKQIYLLITIARHWFFKSIKCSKVKTHMDQNL